MAAIDAHQEQDSGRGMHNRSLTTSFVAALVMAASPLATSTDCERQCDREARSCASEYNYTNCPVGGFGQPPNPAREACLKEVPRGRARCEREGRACASRCPSEPPPQETNAPNSSTNGACPEDLSHLASSMPRYSDSMLSQARQAVLQTNIRQAMSTARAQGYSPRQAAAATLEQARQAEASMPEAESCIRAAAADPHGVLSQLKLGTYQFGTGSITADCARAYVLAHYQALANRGAATAMACMASQQ